MSLKASDGLIGGLDVTLAKLRKKADGSQEAPIETWTYVALYGILQELKKLNTSVSELIGRQRQTQIAMERIDRRLAIGKKLPKGRTKK